MKVDTEEDSRLKLGYRIWSKVGAAYRAHMRGLNPPSNYCEALTLAPYVTSRWTENQRRSYTALIRDAPGPWNPDDPAFLNWLYIVVGGYQKARWLNYTSDELERILADLEHL